MKMNKNLLLSGALASALILGACGSTASADDMEWETEESNGTINVKGNTETGSKNTAQDAVDKALEEYDGTIRQVEYDEDDGVYYYEIEIENGNEDFEVKLNAEDLKVIEKDLDRDNDDRDDDNDQGDRDDDQDDRAATTNSKSADTTEKENVSSEKAFGDDKSTEAVAAAKERFDGILESVSYQEDDGVYQYEVQLESKTEEYEVKLNAENLTVIEEERESDNNERDYKKLEAANQEQIITFEKAVSLAKESVNGEVDEWEYDVDDFKYEFEIGDYEIKINAKTGDVVEIDN